MGGCGDHFWLYYVSVRGQAAEIQTRAKYPRTYHHMRASRKQAGPVQPGHNHGGPVQVDF